MHVCSAGDISPSDEGEVPVYSVALSPGGDSMFLQDVSLLCLNRCKPNLTRFAMLHSAMKLSCLRWLRRRAKNC